MLTKDEQHTLDREHAEAFKAALVAAGTDPALRCDPKSSQMLVWVDHDGCGNVGYWVSSGLRDLHLPEIMFSAEVVVSYVNHEDEHETIAYTVFAEKVPPKHARDIDHQVALVLDAIRTHHVGLAKE